MTSRERIKAILSLDIPDRMGLSEDFWPETLRDYWPKEGYPEGTLPADYFGFDLQGVEGSWFHPEPFPGRDETVEETDAWRVSTNGYGATLKKWKHKSGTPEHIGFDCTSRQVWESKYKPPLTVFDPSRIDMDTFRPAYAKAMAGERHTHFANTMHVELMRSMLGDIVMLENLLLDPDWIRDICRTCNDFFFQAYEYLFREVGLPDAIYSYEDLGFSNGPFMSETTYREVLMPYHAELIGFFHDHNLPFIWHSCGDVRKLVPAMIEAGMDCLQAMEAKAGCNVLELSERYGDHISFIGNIDVTKLNTNDRDVIRKEVEWKVKTLRDRRVPYVFHSDHSIPPDVRFESYQFALEVFRENAAY